MGKIQDQIELQYGQKLRVRVCGICIENNRLLLVHHRALGVANGLWAPPGGGMNYGETAEQALIREFKEETGCTIAIKKFLFVHEYLDPPLHGIELFFEVEICSGTPILGTDPEMDVDAQLLTQIGFYDLKKVQETEMSSLHYVLQNVKSLNELINLKGYFKFH
ncbi:MULTISPECIES: NUDIX hydrolase [Roseivirga]|jgi:8-oxo-dGTP diphosphatase|uniref:Nudix hydrolase domain-containing protein n=1 Tax=Roseivirga thermotolerans TaxID=1758176 RepID=A0ABQ3I6N0_9BACT|nr:MULTISPECIES: NUDIX hydrolase [Roseivirga]MEC7752622.1 NUDIX hydrolase [Bacteroidota bacterium]GHE66689.1 hypothetical protein GCM10011340_22610 [Roseivirga thermotolerans]|tara:strand:- start:704 stop:1195 length:492 start_codon:yes stop_codon:yes gene_type:complete